MSAAPGLSPLHRETETISVRILTDPAGRTESPPVRKPHIAIHMGRSVYMVCQRAGLKHRGWGVHGDIDVVPADTRCVWEPNEPDTALIVGIEPNLLAQTAEELNLRAERLELINRFQIRDLQMENIGWALKAEMELGYPNGRIFRDSLAAALAAALIGRHSSFAVLPAISNQTMSGYRLRRALSYIEDNLKQDLSLTEIAHVVGLSASHLKTTFRQTMGIPIHQYVIQRRVEHAKTLLCEGRLSISEVAAETGFAHQSHMANQMRRILGCSPKVFRRSRRNGNHHFEWARRF